MVALAVRRAAGVYRGRAIIVHDEPGGFPAVRVGGGDLDVTRDADAELLHIAALAAALLLRPQLGIASACQHLVERLDVGPGVVGSAAWRGEREPLGRPPIHPATLPPLHPHPRRQHAPRAPD